jgi:hypothetical protein
MDPIAHAESALADLGGIQALGDERGRALSIVAKAITLAVAEDRAERKDRSEKMGRTVFRLTFDILNEKPITWLVEAGHMEEAIAVASKQMTQERSGLSPWMVRTIEDLGRLMIRT